MYQINDEDEEQKIFKKKLIKLLKSKEVGKLAVFFSNKFCFKAVEEVDT